MAVVLLDSKTVAVATVLVGEPPQPSPWEPIMGMLMMAMIMGMMSQVISEEGGML